MLREKLVRGFLPVSNFTEGQKESICFGIIWVLGRKYFTIQPNIELLRPRYYPAYFFGFYGMSYVIDKWLYCFGRHQATFFDLYPELRWLRSIFHISGSSEQKKILNEKIINPDARRNFEEILKDSPWKHFADVRERPGYLYMKEFLDKKNNNPEEIKDIPPYYNLLEYLKYRHHQIWDPIYEVVEMDRKYAREVLFTQDESPENFAELDKAATDWEEKKVQEKYGKID